MSEMKGFWSYVHRDDERDLGRVVQLAHDIVDGYEGLTAEAIELFLDRDTLSWGDDWGERVNSALSDVAFFIPVLTPMYFKSPECRRELQFFIDATERLGTQRLILPLLYIEVPELHNQDSRDPLVRSIQKIQWKPWTELAFEELASSAYRRGVRELATELVVRVGEVEAVDVSVALQENHEDLGADSENDAPGQLEILASFEDAIPRWSQTLELITGEIVDVREMVQAAGGEIDAANDRSGRGTFARRLTIARNLSQSLVPHAENIEAYCQTFAADLGTIDVGMRLVVNQAKSEVLEDDDSRRKVCEFLEIIRELQPSAETGLSGIAGMAASIEGVEAMSKDLRPPLRRIRGALTSMEQARSIIGEWAGLAAGVDIDCSDLG